MSYTGTRVPMGIVGAVPRAVRGPDATDVERECAYCGLGLDDFGPGVLCVECNELHDLCDTCVEQATVSAQHSELAAAA